jgi:hypothetical protein
MANQATLQGQQKKAETGKGEREEEEERRSNA